MALGGAEQQLLYRLQLMLQIENPQQERRREQHLSFQNGPSNQELAMIQYRQQQKVVNKIPFQEKPLTRTGKTQNKKWR